MKTKNQACDSNTLLTDNVSSFDVAIAASLLSLAELAMSTSDLNNLFLPPGWNKLAIINCVPQIYRYPGVKGFLAAGRAGNETSTSVVLALGIDWTDWLQYYNQGAMAASPLLSWAGAPAGSLTTVVYNAMYNAVRSSLWDSLKFLADKPLRTTGIGLGGPLAQMAALDLRNGNSGPDNQSAPGDVTCYALSTGPSANASLANYFTSKVPDSYIITAGTEANKVDFFPLENSGKLASQLGTQVALPVAVPIFDVPWVERSSEQYLTALGKSPVYPPTHPPTVQQPSGFSRDRAFQYANLCSVAYQRFQHPDAQNMNISPFVVGQNITANGVVFCTLFISVDTIVAAFRGTCTWQEFASNESNSQTKTTTIGPNNVSVHTGTSNLYYGLSAADSELTFKQELIAQLSKVQEQKTLIFTGHGFGGAVANLAAIDITIDGSLTVNFVYTFGANPVGGPDFAKLSDNTLPNSSFHLARNSDPFPQLINKWIGYGQLSTPVSVTGVPEGDSYPYHSIRSYSRLLNPQE
ncbi:hypothetical protein MNBD_GAMMA12-229 [hydrothermal vent metagenome]|uniref:Fungal lipase-type domain-containing protein n=1 Tax=hydrothermal vent metagenome TaxID=652676 RepID=A0A3B0Y4L0_9ZZZZ